MLRKIIPLTLVLFILTASFSTSQAITLDNSTLTDIDSHWSENDITTLYRAGILNGSDNLANPDENITRGEFTALIARTLELDNNLSTPAFSDVGNENIFFNEISAAVSNGLVTGADDGKFYPSSSITREEIMLIISRTLPKSAKKSVSFSDISSDYAYISNLKAAVSSGIISGYADGSFKPKNTATRAESASMLVRMLKASEGTSDENVKNFSKSYISSDIENLQNNTANSTGAALTELSHRLSAAQTIAQNGVTVQKTLKDLALTAFSNTGSLSRCVYDGSITYSITYPDGTSEKKTYDCTVSADIILRGGSPYVYCYNVNLKKSGKINLTWEVYSSAPDYAPEGVNVVSPSSFQISAEALNVDKTALFSNVNFFNSLTYSYMDYAKGNGYDVWPMYKTDFSLSTSHNFLNNAKARQTALELLVKYASKYKIDGINFDFENIYVADRALLTKHIREVTLALHEMGLITSADVTRKELSSSVWSMCYDRDSISETVDYVMLMAYDQYYAGSPAAGSVAGLSWTEDTIKKTLAEVPPDKLVLGIPLYMRLWTVEKGKVTSSKAISMQTAYKLIQENNPTYEWIEKDGQYKISWKEGSKTYMFWLENSDTVKSRIALVSKYALAGVASWRRGLEVQGIWSVILQNL